MAAAAKRQTLKDELLSLNKKRSDMESELKTWQEILTTQGVGMSESLVDNEGFPRGDVDIYQIRTARNKIITLQNDCRSMMGQIEGKLHELHALNAVEGQPPSR